MRVLQACASNDVASRQLAEMVRLDPRLTAEVLKIVNSAYFGTAREVTSIAYAVTMIGHRALRNLVLCISVRDVLLRTDLTGFDSTSFATEALRRAVSARCLAEKVGVGKSQVEIVAGAASRNKMVCVLGLTPTEVEARLLG